MKQTANLTQHWRWRRYISPKWRLIFKGLDGVISQNIEPLITIAVITSNLNIPVYCVLLYYYYYYDSTALWWTLEALSVSWSYTQSVGLIGPGISPSQGRYLHTEQHKHRINAHYTYIHASSGIRTHDPSVRAGEGSSCLRPRGHCNRRVALYRLKIKS
jgi:hypothetical protein